MQRRIIFSNVQSERRAGGRGGLRGPGPLWSAADAANLSFTFICWPPSYQEPLGAVRSKVVSFWRFRERRKAGGLLRSTAGVSPISVIRPLMSRRACGSAGVHRQYLTGNVGLCWMKAARRSCRPGRFYLHVWSRTEEQTVRTVRVSPDSEDQLVFWPKHEILLRFSWTDQVRNPTLPWLSPGMPSWLKVVALVTPW